MNQVYEFFFTKSLFEIIIRRVIGYRCHREVFFKFPFFKTVKRDQSNNKSTTRNFHYAFVITRNHETEHIEFVSRHTSSWLENREATSSFVFQCGRKAYDKLENIWIKCAAKLLFLKTSEILCTLEWNERTTQTEWKTKNWAFREASIVLLTRSMAEIYTFRCEKLSIWVGLKSPRSCTSKQPCFRPVGQRGWGQGSMKALKKLRSRFLCVNDGSSLSFQGT